MEKETEIDYPKLLYQTTIQVFKDMNPKNEIKQKKFIEFLERKKPKKIRKELQRLLTIFENNFPESTLKQVDNLLLFELSKTTIINSLELPRLEFNKKISLYKGDITDLKIDAIVNAANEYLLGCFVPNHPCIDNRIHMKAGPRLRQKCKEIMENQDHLEPEGKAKITEGFCLPVKFVIHTVGPKSNNDPHLLASCYRSSLDIAFKNSVKSIAFCCISCGMFGYDPSFATKIALKTVSDWISQNPDAFDLIVFNVYTQENYQIYQNLLPKFFGEKTKEK
ncbi:poly [adp-ribose] polymerase [Anaeramoeba ignava]|uniref:Poly [adp-ribose] polymerase n=1 Tax=Anaeramoeba ignava TaxID=1746090 RepID=A0A9Q0LGG1_ANAIG|nr:poly [adp-ribose] polymerase [Anaeramoeba ignava]